MAVHCLFGSSWILSDMGNRTKVCRETKHDVDRSKELCGRTNGQTSGTDVL